MGDFAKIVYFGLIAEYGYEKFGKKLDKVRILNINGHAMVDNTKEITNVT